MRKYRKEKSLDRWKQTVIALVILGVLIFAAFCAPEVVFSRYDSGQTGNVLFLEKKEGRYQTLQYQSFSEKLGALADCQGKGIEFGALRMQEITDEEQKQHRFEDAAEEIRDYFYTVIESYDLTLEDYKMAECCLYTLYSADEEVPGISFWGIRMTSGEDGEIRVLLDAEFNKIYGFSLTGTQGQIVKELESVLNDKLSGYSRDIMDHWMQLSYEYYELDWTESRMSWMMVPNDEQWDYEQYVDAAIRNETIDGANELAEAENKEDGEWMILDYHGIFCFGDQEVSPWDAIRKGYYSDNMSYIVTEFRMSELEDGAKKLSCGLSAMLDFLNFG